MEPATFRKTLEGDWCQVDATWPSWYLATASGGTPPPPAAFVVVDLSGEDGGTSPRLFVHAAVFSTVMPGLEFACEALAAVPVGSVCFRANHALLVAIPVFPWCRGHYVRAEDDTPVDVAVPALRTLLPFMPGDVLNLPGVHSLEVNHAAEVGLEFEEAVGRATRRGHLLVERAQPRGGCVLLAVTPLPF